MYYTGGPAANIHVNTYTAMGGLNLWVRAINQELFKLRIGAEYTEHIHMLLLLVMFYIVESAEVELVEELFWEQNYV